MYLSYEKLYKMIHKVRNEYEELHESDRQHEKKIGFIGLRAIDKIKKEILEDFRNSSS